MTRFTSILIANRGEIACRVIRTAKALGYRTVAVYSEADAEAPHVLMADEAICIGPGPANESYLVAENILRAAAESGAEAVHPGYGFMSENAGFAQACEDARLVFIGPTADSINRMGNKAESKRLMIEAGVPCIPGYEGEDQSDATLLAEADKIDLPLMVKAAAGGGGKGMRLVHDRAETADAIKLSRAEGESSFGSGELILEKAIIRPRHVEVQVFADTHGNTVYMGERDCSVQRRHQKVVEEAPCTVMTDKLRAEMGAAAVAAAESINYRGAGTVEFLLDDSGKFYFLEMNTRLQVEHPVTELITGLDLVALQIQVAQGEELGLTQDDISLSGHAIEVRLYSEDPTQNFLPTSGPIDLWQPATGTGVRIDDGIRSGQDISPFYDPMVAKVIAYGPNREVARLRLVEALKNTLLFGPKNNKTFLIDCLEKQKFIDGEATTAFIGEEFTEEEILRNTTNFADAAVAAVLDITLEHERLLAKTTALAGGLKNWFSANPVATPKHYRLGEEEFELSVMPIDAQTYRVSDQDQSIEIELLSREGQPATGAAHIRLNDTRHIAHFHDTDAMLYVSIEGRSAAYRDLVRLEGQLDQAGGGHGQDPVYGIDTGDASAAMVTRAYFERYGATRRDLASIAITFRNHASLNPSAMRRKAITTDDYLASRPMCTPLCLLDYPQIADGAACVLVTRTERARDLHKPAIMISGMQPLPAGRDEFIWSYPGFGVAQQEKFPYKADLQPVYKMAELDHSAIDAFYTYDGFSILVWMALERWGFCPQGEAYAFTRNGRIGIGGELPMNTSGGSMSEAHLLGWNQQVEIVRQLRGECGERQLANADVIQWANAYGDSLIYRR